MENHDNEDIIIQIEETVHLFLWPNKSIRSILSKISDWEQGCEDVILKWDNS
jgi:hypothetical protein